MNNDQAEVPEILPSHYLIYVQVGEDELHYSGVVAFQVEDRMLKFMDDVSTHIIPISERVVCIEITPVYTEESRIVQVP